MNENYDEFIVTGDMNTDYMSDSNGNLKSNARYLYDIFLNHKMQQTVKEKTYPQNNVNSGSILDIKLVLVRNNRISEVKDIPNMHKKCDHSH